ncbi:hypothetical protein [Sneathiella sp.]|uniref:hypothetical protein n=1 Tax=Sneathiella sp. TaxID=1964365 RepID=UPI002628A6AE|nr:hypothetical protein [Sneathiella sp.]MDF2366312.1 hypothetical protein [Sneathiella sp.]
MKNRDIIFIFVLGVLVGALSFGVLNVFGHYEAIFSLSAIEWSAVATAGATIGLAILTFLYVRLTGRVLSSQTDPYITITVASAPHGPYLLQLLIQNAGRGLARDIRFEIYWHESVEKSEITDASAKFMENLKEGPIRDGIPALASGETRRVNLNIFPEVKRALDGRKITAICRFRSNQRDMPAVESVLEVDSFAHTSVADSPLLKVANELEKIGKLIGVLATGSKKLKIDVETMPDNESSDKK